MRCIFIYLMAFAWGAKLLAADQPADAAMGVYEGFWTTADGKKGRVTAQIRPIGEKRYDGFVAIYRARALEWALKLAPNAEGSMKFKGSAAKSQDGSLTASLNGSCEIADGALKGSFKGDMGEGTFEAERVHHESPTMGAKSPAMATVLFDGKPSDQWSDFHWKVTPEGAMVVGGGDIHAAEKYANYNLHLEFRTPLMPTAQGQARGNSGVYLQDIYEVQVLDSFGLFPLGKDDCGAIYSMKAPEVNACLPPGEWQTYDITFVQSNASRNGNPTVTVTLNGVMVIEKFELPQKTPSERGFLRLQDHGNPVEYRNIWVEPFFAADRK